MAAKKVPAKKVSSKKPIIGKDGLTAYQRKLSVANEKRSAVSKGKLKPYNAKWAANAKKQGKRTKLDKFGELALEFSPLGGITYAAEAVTGKSMRGPMNKPAKKTGRLAAAANSAFYLTPVGAGGKIKKGVQTVRGIRGAGKLLSGQTNVAKNSSKKVYDTYIDNLVSKEIAKYKRQLASQKKKK